MKKNYLMPLCEDISLLGLEMVCTSAGTETFVYNEGDPNNNYIW